MGTCACMLNCFSHVPLCNPMNCSPLCSSVHGILQARILAKTGTTQRDGTGREEGSGWGTRVYLWQIHVDIWQNQYNIVKLKNKIKYIKKKKKEYWGGLPCPPPGGLPDPGIFPMSLMSPALAEGLFTIYIYI